MPNFGLTETKFSFVLPYNVSAIPLPELYVLKENLKFQLGGLMPDVKMQIRDVGFLVVRKMLTEIEWTSILLWGTFIVQREIS